MAQYVKGVQTSVVEEDYFVEADELT